MRSVSDVISNVKTVKIQELQKPKYSPNENKKGIFLGVESMRNHMTDEGWQIALACKHSGYTLCGHNLTLNSVDVLDILERINPGIVILQDKREWDVSPNCFRDKQAKFKNVNYLKFRDDLFKLTILKDAHQKPHYHMESANEIDCHAWITYYNSNVVKHVAPYVRKEHLIRTYHSIDSNIVPEFSEVSNREKAFLSGAISNVYPMRKKLVRMLPALPRVVYKQHPGYHRYKCHTPEYLKLLSKFKISICTSSIYGYALRKIIESTACGCIVITDLPKDEELPFIEDNLIRVNSDITRTDFNNLIADLERNYNYELQEYLAGKAKYFYDYRVQGERLVSQIQELREKY